VKSLGKKSVIVWLAVLMAVLPVRVSFSMQQEAPLSGGAAVASVPSHLHGDMHMDPLDGAAFQAVSGVMIHQGHTGSGDDTSQSHGSHAAGHCASCFVAFFDAPSFVLGSNSSTVRISISMPLVDAQLPNLFRPPRS